LTQGFGSRQLLPEIIIAVAGFSDKGFYDKIERKLEIRKMNKPEGHDLAGQTFAGEVTLPE
jgi:hypothetical protein